MPEAEGELGVVKAVESTEEYLILCMVGVVCGRIGAWKSSKNISRFRLNFGRNLGSNSQALTLRDFVDFAGARLTYMRTFERKGKRIE